VEKKRQAVRQHTETLTPPRQNNNAREKKIDHLRTFDIDYQARLAGIQPHRGNMPRMGPTDLLRVALRGGIGVDSDDDPRIITHHGWQRKR
jgi:hypothetical protein